MLRLLTDQLSVEPLASTVVDGPTWSVHALLLLVHVEVDVRVLNIAHIWALLLQTLDLPSVGAVASLSAHRVLTHLAAHRDVVGHAVFRMCCEHQTKRVLGLVGCGEGVRRLWLLLVLCLVTVVLGHVSLLHFEKSFEFIAFTTPVREGILMIFDLLFRNDRSKKVLLLLLTDLNRVLFKNVGKLILDVAIFLRILRIITVILTS